MYYLMAIEKVSWVVVMNTFNPSTWKGEADRSVSFRLAWSTAQSPGHPGLHKETLSPKTEKRM